MRMSGKKKPRPAENDPTTEPAGPGRSEAAKGPEPAPEPSAVEAEPGAEGQTKESAAALQDRLLRLQADFENFRKRALREKRELARQANEDLVQELLPVLDHLDLAIDAASEHAGGAAFLEGFRLVSDQLLAALARFGVTPVDGTGETFDPNRHEAVSHLASDEVPENKVITQVRRGYSLGDKLLRAAQVVVSSGPVDKGTAGKPEKGED
jgi:molecular chaperone GrpE